LISASLPLLCVGLGYALGQADKYTDPAPTFSLKFESSHSVFYALRWDDHVMVMQDRNRDGILDEWKLRVAGELVFRVIDRNHDQRLDEWWRMDDKDNGTLARDDDFDGATDYLSGIAVLRE